jgi:hypothetical protein
LLSDGGKKAAGYFYFSFWVWRRQPAFLPSPALTKVTTGRRTPHDTSLTVLNSPGRFGTGSPKIFSPLQYDHLSTGPDLLQLIVFNRPLSSRCVTYRLMGCTMAFDIIETATKVFPKGRSFKASHSYATSGVCQGRFNCFFRTPLPVIQIPPASRTGFVLHISRKNCIHPLPEHHIQLGQRPTSCDGKAKAAQPPFLEFGKRVQPLPSLLPPVRPQSVSKSEFVAHVSKRDSVIFTASLSS